MIYFHLKLLFLFKEAIFMIITKKKKLILHKKVVVGGQLKKLSQKFLLGAVCAGLMLNSLAPAGRSSDIAS